MMVDLFQPWHLLVLGIVGSGVVLVTVLPFLQIFKKAGFPAALSLAINAGDYDAGSQELRATRINGEPAPANMLQGMENRSDMRQDIWNGKDPTN